MKDKYIPGQDCGCYAYSESECGCGADWTPSEVYELRGKLERERALAEQRGRLYDTAIRQIKALQVQVDELNDKLRYIEVESSHNWQNRERDRDAIAKWKEARSE